MTGKSRRFAKPIDRLKSIEDQDLGSPPDSDDDWKPKEWYCYNCAVIVPLKTRCVHCGKRERDIA